jgi:hypothetical protein
MSCALRFYVRVFTKAGLGSDDWLILAAAVAGVATAALYLCGRMVYVLIGVPKLISSALGKIRDPDGSWIPDHAPNHTHTSQDEVHYKLVVASAALYYTVTGATKLGILLMYRRIFNISRSFRLLLFVVSGMVIAWWVGCTIAELTSCIPLKWLWISGFDDPRYCFNYFVYWRVSAACEVVLDVFILFLPISVVVRMRLSLQEKLAVSGIFLLGGLYVPSCVSPEDYMLIISEAVL